MRPAGAVKAIPARAADVTLIVLHVRTLTGRALSVSANPPLTLRAAQDTTSRHAKGVLDRD